MLREDMSWLDAGSLAFTSPAFDRDMEVVGHAVIELYVSCDARDFDCLAYLLEVEPDGTPRYLAEGLLRASCRAEQATPYKPQSLPFRRQTRGDALPYEPDSVVRMRIELTPIGRLVRTGSRLRVLVAAKDGEVYATLNDENPVTLAVHSTPKARSWIDVPLRPFHGGD